MGHYTGVVKFFNPAQNLGAIEGDTSKEAFLFTAEYLPKGVEDIPAGQKVTFDRYPYEKRIWAVHIELI